MLTFSELLEVALSGQRTHFRPYKTRVAECVLAWDRVRRSVGWLLCSSAGGRIMVRKCDMACSRVKWQIYTSVGKTGNMRGGNCFGIGSGDGLLIQRV